MTRVELAPQIQEDFDRILDHLLEYAVDDARDRIDEIVNALNVLEHNPLIGQPVSNSLKELIMGRRSRGYVALYSYIEEIDTAVILAIRNTQEAGYSRE